MGPVLTKPPAVIGRCSASSTAACGVPVLTPPVAGTWAPSVGLCACWSSDDWRAEAPVKRPAREHAARPSVSFFPVLVIAIPYAADPRASHAARIDCYRGSYQNQPSKKLRCINPEEPFPRSHMPGPQRNKHRPSARQDEPSQAYVIDHDRIRAQLQVQQPSLKYTDREFPKALRSLL